MTNSEQQQGTIDLLLLVQRAFGILKRTWLLCMILLLLGGIAGGVIGYLRWTPLYETNATFAITNAAGETMDFATNQRAAEDFVSSFSSILQSDIMQSALKDANDGVSTQNALYQTRIGDTNLIVIHAVGPSRASATAVMDAFMSCYSRVFKMALLKADLVQVATPEEPFVCNRPALWKDALVGLIAAAALYALYGFFFFFLHKAVQGQEDIKEYLHSFCISSVPMVRHKKDKDQAPMLVLGNDMRYAALREATRNLERRITNDARKNDRKVYLLAEANEGEGAPLVALNLALTVAKKEIPTAYFCLYTDEKKKQAMLDALGEEKIQLDFEGDRIIDAYAIKGQTLHIFFVHIYTGDVNRVLEIMRALLQSARDNYDRVYISAIPVLQSYLSTSLLDLSDAGILVVRENYSPITMLVDTMERLNQCKSPMFGSILVTERVRRSKYGRGRYGSSYHYGYGYGYSYGYHYGYGDYGYGSYGYGYGKGGYGYGAKSKFSKKRRSKEKLSSKTTKTNE